jgi:uncharacterized membrane protein (UPF0127 family)
LREGEVLAALEVAETRQERMQGLLGRDGIDGAILLQPARSVHSVGMTFTIDVAFCTTDLVVLRTISLRPGRMTRPSLRGGIVVEAESGSFARWTLRPGDQLEVRE